MAGADCCLPLNHLTQLPAMRQGWFCHCAHCTVPLPVTSFMALDIDALKAVLQPIQVNLYNETEAVVHHGKKVGLIEAFKAYLGEKIYCTTTPGALPTHAQARFACSCRGTPSRCRAIQHLPARCQHQSPCRALCAEFFCPLQPQRMLRKMTV